MRHPLVLVQAEIVEEVPDGAEGRLPDADRWDPVGLDHGDRDPVAEGGLQVCRAHPAGGAATHHDHRIDHYVSPLSVGSLDNPPLAYAGAIWVPFSLHRSTV